MNTIGAINAATTEIEQQRIFRMSSSDQLELEEFVRGFNRELYPDNPTRQAQQSLGKDDFLKLLITQLSYQDPTSPMEDKQFIAQMAQFSTLEQMTSMAGDFSKLTSMLMNSEASTSLGKNVEIVDGERVTHGMVQAVTRDQTPQVLVNGSFHSWDKVTKVFTNENEKE
ncbi:MAG: flagellar hook assembly protein FlgD [Treponema sp.]|jgi:flagellar basal-body rod modification protein FlgD|nr:flagellar hook assembly protein FlgD [Treponema sp.]